MKISDLTPNPGNPRKISEEKLETFKKSIENLGDLSGIVYNRATGRLVAGHQTTKVLDPSLEIKIEKTFHPPTSKGTVAEGWVINGEERTKYREVLVDQMTEQIMNIAANKGAGEWDYPKLIDWITEIDANNYPLEFTMFSVEELTDLLAPITEPKANAKVCPHCGKNLT